MNKYRLTWAPEGKTIAIVEAKDAKTARKMAPQPYRKYLGEVAVTLVGFRGAIWAKPGMLLLGGVPSVASSWFTTRQEAEDWLYAMADGQADKIDLQEVERSTIDKELDPMTVGIYKPIPHNTTEAEVYGGKIRCKECGWTTHDTLSGRLGIESHIRLRHPSK